MTKDELQEKYPPTIVDIQGVGICEVYTPKEVTAIINDLFAKRIVGVTLNDKCKPKFNDWRNDNFKQKTEFYWADRRTETLYSFKEIESKYIMEFKTNI